MTVRVERVFDLPAPVSEVWGFISDPERRARPISVVEDFEVTGERTARWTVRLPIPYIDATVGVDTEDVQVDDERYVRFVGRSRAMRVVGEHELEPVENGTRLTNRFVVEGRVPGVERYFRKNLDGELANLERAIRESVGVEDVAEVTRAADAGDGGTDGDGTSGDGTSGDGTHGDGTGGTDEGDDDSDGKGWGPF